MSDLETADAQARERALAVDESFIVQAPAGSGKTTVLTQRYLQLLATVDEPEQVLAITFTRKAAGEMRERVRQALDGNITVKSPADELTLRLATAARVRAAQRRWGIEDSTARLRIQTIDSFNHYLASSLPITSRSGFARGVADSPDDLYNLAARETMRHAEADPEYGKQLELLLRRLDNRWLRLEDLIAAMLPRRAEWLPNLPQLSGEDLVPRIEASLTAIVSEELANAATLLPAGFTEQASRLARFAAGNLDPDAHADVGVWRDSPTLLTLSLADLPRWRFVTRLALTAEGTLRKLLNKTMGVPADDPDARALRDEWKQTLGEFDSRQAAALARIGALPEPRIPEKARRALDALARILLLAAQQLTLVFNAAGECDHPEIAGAARRALTENASPTPLAERLGTRLMHVLVDEFQDTSRDQYDLLLSLTQDWSAGDGRTLFVVGDPMQSIYGFRNAEVGRFATVRDGGLANVRLTPLELRRNFRSAPALVHWCNDVFARVFPAEDDSRSSAVRHLASVAARAKLKGEPRVYRVGLDGGARAEAQSATRLIANIRRDRPDESIAVLASARTHLRAIRTELARAQVPFIGVNLEPLSDVSVVRDLEALLRALDSPLDRIAWLAVLRAPFVGLALPDLTRVSEAAGADTIVTALRNGIAGVTPDGFERLLRATPILLSGWSERERESRAHAIERVWLALGGAATCSGAADVAHARRFLAAVDEADQQRTRGRAQDLQRMMQRLYAVDPSQPDAVSLMTIHGAKGLEFDHVFVLGIGLRGRGDESRLLNWLQLPRKDGRDHLIMAPLRFRDQDDAEDDDDINQFLRGIHRDRAIEERARQAYVALTRARYSLHVYVHPRTTEKDGVFSFAPPSNTLLHNLWPALGEHMSQFETIGAENTDEIVLPAVTQQRRRLPRQIPAWQIPPDVLARGELVPVNAEEDAIEFSWVRQTARRVGTVVHEALERFAHGKLPGEDELTALRARLESRLQALGVEGTAAEAGAERALQALRATLADERGRWLFDAGHREAQSELALSGVRAGHIVNAVIDRTFVADGTRWVVDFKTSPHEGGDLPAFLDAEALRYEAQLKRYAHLARGLGLEPVRAGLYFPLLGAWREVAVD
ncbi:MAG: UvrD-helicase domain-containing protein [Pseudomonadota bacterium]